jgi:hypothetical protein
MHARLCLARLINSLLFPASSIADVLIMVHNWVCMCVYVCLIIHCNGTCACPKCSHLLTKLFGSGAQKFKHCLRLEVWPKSSLHSPNFSGVVHTMSAWSISLASWSWSPVTSKHLMPSLPNLQKQCIQLYMELYTYNLWLWLQWPPSTWCPACQTDRTQWWHRFKWNCQEKKRKRTQIV